MTAKLVLLPLSKSECRKLLKDNGKFPDKIDPNQDFGYPPSAKELDKAEEAFNSPRKTIILKLSKESHIIDLDSDSSDDENCDENNKVIYSKKYQDGSEAARVPLGRNKSTGIHQWTKISRALCEVSLHKPIEGGKKKIQVLEINDTTNGSEETPPVVSSNNNVVVDLLDSSDGKLKSDTSVDCDKKPSSKSGDNDKAIASLGMRKSANDHNVWLDGQLITAPLGREIPIQDGSILSLFGVTGLSYQIKLFQDGDKKKSPKKKSPRKQCPKKRKLNTPTKKEETPVKEKETPVKEEMEQPSEREKLRKRAHDDMIAECMCAMCMEILVKSTFAYPCGHAFCQDCSNNQLKAAEENNQGARSTRGFKAQRKGTCPTCRGDVEGWMTARAYDNKIYSIALQGCFEHDDAQEYLERREAAGMDAPSDLERGSILNTEDGANGCMNTGLASYNPTTQSLDFKPLSPIRNGRAAIRNANNGHRNTNLLPENVKSEDIICLD